MTATGTDLLCQQNVLGRNGITSDLRLPIGISDFRLPLSLSGLYLPITQEKLKRRVVA